MESTTAPSTPEKTPSVPIPAVRRSATVPTKLQPQRAPSAGSPSADNDVETLYNHWFAKVVNFTTPVSAIASATAGRAGQDDGGTLPWTTPTERTMAAGAFRVYRIPNSVSFLNSGSLLHPILPKSQCWCVDGESKFVLRIRANSYYRIEMPYSTEEEKNKVEEFKTVLGNVLQYEKTPCPFKRGFVVELPKAPDAPVRRKSRYSSERVKRWKFDKKWEREDADRLQPEMSDTGTLSISEGDDDTASVMTSSTRDDSARDDSPQPLHRIEKRRPESAKVDIEERRLVFSGPDAVPVSPEIARRASSFSIPIIEESVKFDRFEEPEQLDGVRNSEQHENIKGSEESENTGGPQVSKEIEVPQKLEELEGLGEPKELEQTKEPEQPEDPEQPKELEQPQEPVQPKESEQPKELEQPIELLEPREFDEPREVENPWESENPWETENSKGSEALGTSKLSEQSEEQGETEHISVPKDPINRTLSQSPSIDSFYSFESNVERPQQSPPFVDAASIYDDALTDLENTVVLSTPTNARKDPILTVTTEDRSAANEETPRRPSSEGRRSSGPSTPTLMSDSDDSFEPPLPDVPTPPDTIRLRTLSGTSRRRAFSPMPPAANLFHPSKANATQHLTSAIVQKTCSMLLGPPAHLVVLMLRIAAKIAAGTFGIDSYYLRRGRRRIPGTWDSSGEEDEWDEDDYGIPLGNLESEREDVRRVERRKNCEVD